MNGKRLGKEVKAIIMTAKRLATILKQIGTDCIYKYCFLENSMKKTFNNVRLWHHQQYVGHCVFNSCFQPRPKKKYNKVCFIIYTKSIYIYYAITSDLYIFLSNRTLFKCNHSIKLKQRHISFQRHQNVTIYTWL